MSATLFVLTSPLQARHAGHYAAQTGLDFDRARVAFVKSGREPDNDRTRAALAAAGFPHVREFEPLLPRGRVALTAQGKPHAAALRDYDDYASRRAFRQAVDRYFDAQGAAFDRVVLGDYRPPSFRQFLSQLDLDRVDCVLLDDGAVSRAVMAFRESRAHAAEVFRAKPFRSDVIDAPDPLAYPDPSELTFFSIYDGRLAEGDVLLRNAYYDEVLAGDPPAIRDELWIAGCSHVESGIASAAAYADLCEAARRLFPHGPCLYLPHRRENPEKVRAVAARIGAEVRPTEGIEDLIAATRAAPAALASFGSTVLDTVSRMVGDRTACALVAPPPSYFLGPRREHLEEVIRANVRCNPRVVGLFAHDPAAATRAQASAVLRAETSIPRPVAPHAASAMAGVAPASLMGFAASTEADGSTLLLEREEHELRRFEIAAFDVAPGEAAFVAFRLAGEGRPNVRLRVVSEADGSVYADCDLDLDEACSAHAAHDGVAIWASVHVDARRRAVVRLLAASAAGGRHLVQVIARPNAAAASAFGRGDPYVGLSVPPPLEWAGAAIALPPGRDPCVLQAAYAEGAIGVLRLALDGRPFDLVLRPPGAALRPPPGAAWAAWAALAASPPRAPALLAASTPLVIARGDGPQLLVRSGTDSVTIPLDRPDAAVTMNVDDPHTGERILIELAAGTGEADPARCYALAW